MSVDNWHFSCKGPKNCGADFCADRAQCETDRSLGLGSSEYQSSKSGSGLESRPLDRSQHYWVKTGHQGERITLGPLSFNLNGEVVKMVLVFAILLWQLCIWLVGWSVVSRHSKAKSCSLKESVNSTDISGVLSMRAEVNLELLPCLNPYSWLIEFTKSTTWALHEEEEKLRFPEKTNVD